MEFNNMIYGQIQIVFVYMHTYAKLMGLVG